MPKLDHLRPSGLHHNPAYSHVVTASGARTIYISGQVSVDEEGRIVGEGDIAAQTTQVMQNLGHALKAAGATYANIVKITTFVVNYKPARPARPSSKAWSRRPAPSSASPRSPRRNG
ncbi:enamine deaminase RidA (YjgF/YER057c/UK114 family) [Bradyrhizobium sp. S3.5.5]